MASDPNRPAADSNPVGGRLTVDINALGVIHAANLLGPVHATNTAERVRATNVVERVQGANVAPSVTRPDGTPKGKDTPQVTHDLIVFLRACLDERAARARALPPGPWAWQKAEGDEYESLVGADGRYVLSSSDAEGYRSWIDKHEGFDSYLPEIDPRYVLAEVETKRELLKLHRPMELSDPMMDVCYTCDVTGRYPEYPCMTLRLLALPYADRPGYKEEWRP